MQKKGFFGKGGALLSIGSTELTVAHDDVVRLLNSKLAVPKAPLVSQYSIMAGG